MDCDPIVDNGHNRRNAEKVQAVVQGLSVGLPEVESVAEPVDEEYSFQTIEPDDREGFDQAGNYHVTVDPEKWKKWLDMSPELRDGTI